MKYNIVMCEGKSQGAFSTARLAQKMVDYLFAEDLQGDPSFCFVREIEGKKSTNEKGEVVIIDEDGEAHEFINERNPIAKSTFRAMK